MVAYSFKSQFVAPIRSGAKCQTVRADRKRHAQPGERMQLYTGMRTKACARIRPDVLCLAVHGIEICTSRLLTEGGHLTGLASIAINGIPLDAGEIEWFARLDGFDPAFAPGIWSIRTARAGMGNFWLKEHGEGRFAGVLIQWGLE